MKRTRGAIVMVASLSGFLLLAAVMNEGLRSALGDRFIVTLDTVGRPARRLPLDQPLRVTISGRPAPGPGPAYALAVLLGGDGALAAGPAQMAAEPEAGDRRGRPGFRIEFPPLRGAALPRGGVVVAVALRLPGPAGRAPTAAEVDGALARVRRAVHAGSAQAEGETHQDAFDWILREARALGGHAELIAAEVRLSP